MTIKGKARTTALAFVVTMGIVSLFSDMTHEGASSILGAFLSLAGASAAAIGFFSGLGELVGYGLRLVTGIVADRTRRYWPITIIGYVIDVGAIPLLALVPHGGWMLACMLLVIERMGKAIKKPAKDTLTSFAASQAGAGKSFALQEFLDQIGATIGPVIVFLVVWAQRHTDAFTAYRIAFAVLGVPAICTLTALLIARSRFPNPDRFEPEPAVHQGFHLTRPFVLYVVGICLIAFGFIDFPLITMHVQRLQLMSTDTLPLLYAGAMIVDAFAALVFGWLYDKVGMGAVMGAALLAAPFALLVFAWPSRGLLFAGVALWGVGMGAQESILKAVVGSVVPKTARSTGYGVFETAWGVAWFLGSWLMGVLYDADRPWMIAVSLAAQLAALPFFWWTAHAVRTQPAAAA